MNGAQNEQQQGVYTDAQINQGPQVPPAGSPGAYGAGYEAKLNPNANRKSPLVATLLSCMPGLGQIYVGYYQQGFTNMFVVAGTIAILSSSVMRGAEPFFGVFLSFFWIYQMMPSTTTVSKPVWAGKRSPKDSRCRPRKALCSVVRF